MQNNQNNKKKENFRKLFEDSKHWPSCFEKCLIKSLYYVKTANEATNEPDAINNVENLLSVELAEMEQRLVIEGLECDEYTETIKCLKTVLDNQNLNCLEKDLEKMLKELRALDINKIRELRAEIDKATTELKDKEVILLLGNLKDYINLFILLH